MIVGSRSASKSQALDDNKEADEWAEWKECRVDEESSGTGWIGSKDVV